jgi:hypothetical protein
VLNLSNPSYREPQSLFVLLYYLNMIDMAIFVEGFNEVAFASNAPTYPEDFPWLFVWGPLVGEGLSTTTLGTVGQLSIIDEREKKATKFFLLPGLRQSMLCHLIWKAYINRLDASKSRLRSQLEKGFRADVGYEKLIPSTYEGRDRVEIYIEKYSLYIRMAHAASLSTGVPVFFFLQPNQYLKGSKPLSKKELKESITDENVSQEIGTYYPQLRTIYEELADDGFNTIDLTQAFAHEERDLYIDDCCHVNSLGATIIGAALAAEIAQRRDWLDSVPNASDRPHRLISE